MIKRPLILFISFLAAWNTISAQPYQYYFGNIHAHSSYSDGNKDSGNGGCKLPGDSYAYARQSYNFNFLGISEHNHSEAGMTLADYKKGLFQADTANRNGAFVCMYGMEYGVISNGGHVVVYGIDSLIGWEQNNYNIYCPEYSYNSLWKIIADRPNAFATLAHPENTDYNNISTTLHNDTADVAIVGCAVRSGGAFSQTKDYSDSAPSTTYTSYFRRMLAAGYKLGPTIDHDNHYSTFGRTAQSRTVVLAQSLNRDSIMAAYRAMRFYASDDWNTKVSFTVNAYPMGSTVKTSVDPTINVSITDPDAGDNVSSVKLYYGVPGSGALSTVLTTVNAASFSYVHSIAAGAAYYYYLEITQADGDKIWTTPIWVNKDFTVLPIDFITLKTEVKQQQVNVKATLAKTGYKTIELEKSFRGVDFTVINTVIENDSYNYNFIDQQPSYGYQYYRLKCTDKSGLVSYSTVVSAYFVDERLLLVNTYPNPAHNMVNISLKSSINGKAQIRIYNEEGRLTSLTEANINVGLNVIPQDVQAYSSGKYYVQVETPDAKVETSFIKK